MDQTPHPEHIDQPDLFSEPSQGQGAAEADFDIDAFAQRVGDSAPAYPYTTDKYRQLRSAGMDVQSANQAIQELSRNPGPTTGEVQTLADPELDAMFQAQLARTVGSVATNTWTSTQQNAYAQRFEADHAARTAHQRQITDPHR